MGAAAHRPGLCGHGRDGPAAPGGEDELQPHAGAGPADRADGGGKGEGPVGGPGGKAGQGSQRSGAGGSVGAFFQDQLAHLHRSLSPLPPAVGLEGKTERLLPKPQAIQGGGSARPAGVVQPGLVRFCRPETVSGTGGADSEGPGLHGGGEEKGFGNSPGDAEGNFGGVPRPGGKRPGGADQHAFLSPDPAVAGGHGCGQAGDAVGAVARPDDRAGGCVGSPAKGPRGAHPGLRTQGAGVVAFRGFGESGGHSADGQGRV